MKDIYFEQTLKSIVYNELEQVRKAKPGRNQSAQHTTQHKALIITGWQKLAAFRRGQK